MLIFSRNFFIYILLLLFPFTSSAVELKIAYWSDFHSRNLPSELEINDKLTQLGGIGLLAGMIDSLKSDANQMLLISSGDELTGSATATVSKGKSQVKLLNKLGLDFMVPGSRDFYYGWKTLKKTLHKAEFKVVLANVMELSSKTTIFPPHAVIRKNGIDIAVSGLIKADFTKVVNRDGILGLDIINPDIEAERFVTTFRDSVDLTILVSHLGWVGDSSLASKTSGIDVIIGGYDHITLNSPRVINRTVIVQAGAFGKNLGFLALDVDTTGAGIVNFEGKIIRLLPGMLQPPKKISKLAYDIEKKYTRKLTRKIGYLETDWNSSKYEQCNLAQWTAGAIHSIAPSSSLALINNGILGKGLKRGDITEKDIWEIFPEDNPIVVFQISGTELVKGIEMQISGEGEILTWSGLTLAASDDMISSLKVKGYPVTPLDEFSVITTGFVWDHINAYLGIKYSRNRPSFYIPGNFRDFILEAIENQKVISTPLDSRWIEN